MLLLIFSFWFLGVNKLVTHNSTDLIISKHFLMKLLSISFYECTLFYLCDKNVQFNMESVQYF